MRKRSLPGTLDGGGRGPSRQVFGWRLCAREQPARWAEGRPPPRGDGRRTLFSREQNSDLGPRLESPNASQSQETTRGRNGRAATDRIPGSPARGPVENESQDGPAQGADHRLPSAPPRPRGARRGPRVGRRPSTAQAPAAATRRSWSARPATPTGPNAAIGARSSKTPRPDLLRRETGRRATVSRGGSSAAQDLPRSWGAFRWSLRCRERRWIPRRRADSEMLPPQSERTRWMCSHSIRAREGAR